MAGPGYSLDPDEQVVRHIYHHWIDLAVTASMAAVMIIAAVALTYVYARFVDKFPSYITSGFVMFAVVVFLALAGLILVTGNFIYRRNYLLLTNKHLIQVEQHGLFHSEVDQVSLGRVQDVAGKQPGLLATALGFGTITIQSAGEQRQFVFVRTPDPQGLADYILEKHEDFLKAHPGQGGE